MIRLVKVSAVLSGLALVSANAFASEELVSTDAEALLRLEGSLSPQAGEFDEVREFLQCFTDNMDLPAQVYLGCGLSVARAGLRCSRNGLNFKCVRALLKVGQECAAPVSKAIQSVQVCLQPDQTGTEFLID